MKACICLHRSSNGRGSRSISFVNRQHKSVCVRKFEKWGVLNGQRQLICFCEVLAPKTNKGLENLCGAINVHEERGVLPEKYLYWGTAETLESVTLVTQML